MRLLKRAAPKSDEPSLCDQCDGPLDSAGNCQACLLKLGISQVPDDEQASPFAQLPSLEKLNEQFPQLEITRLIGRGGMGAIYHARQTTLDRDVALKVIAREVAGDSAFIERFEREAKTLAKLSHPNIVTVYDFGRTPDGQAYLIMEYVDGINLREAISSGSVCADDSLGVVRTICSALEYAHSKGVVHRDIKPENILLGEDGTLKVADFGIAKIIDDSVRTPTLTATRQVLGSLHYLAPEHLESPEQVDHRVDLYALGVVFYELLTGQLPLGRYEPPSVLNNEIDQRIDAIALKTLNRKPKLRYQSAAELQTDLSELSSLDFPEHIPFAEPVNSPTTASVPFTCEAMGGFAEAVGIAHADGKSMSIEYRVRDAFWGTVKSETHVVDIPVHKLQRVDLYPGVFSAKLVLMADKISTLDKLPNAETGRVELKIKRGDQELAEELVSLVGRGSSASAPVRFASKLGEATVHNDSSHWTTLGILMILCAIFNAGALAAGEIMAAHELNRHNEELIIAAIMMAVSFGPIAILQFVTGLTCLVARPRGLARTACIVSMLPATPGWIIGFPTGLWGFLWLRKEPTENSAAKSAPPKSEPSQKWGATTMMFLRESRWSRTVAALNILALLVAVGAFVIYKRGFFPTQIQYRIVDQNTPAQALADAINARLGEYGETRINFDTRPVERTAESARERLPDGDRLWVQTTGYNQEIAEELLAIEGTIQFVWVRADNGNAELTAGDTSLLQNGSPAEILVSPDLQLDKNFTRPGKLGAVVDVAESILKVRPDFISKLTKNGSTRLSVELTAVGREELTGAMPAEGSFGGIGLVVEGVLEGFAPLDGISGKRINFNLDSRSDVSPDAIIAAIRGPEIPSQLERIE